MSQAKIGDTVKVHYTGKLDDGSVFDSSENEQPLEFTIGQGQLIPDFENAVVDMSPGDSTTVHITAENAYGPYHEEMVIVVNRSDLPENFEPSVNQRLQIRQESGREFAVTVIDVSENDVTFDGNHVLAGKDLTFDIQLVEIAE
jgi:peptidylprolyl isomerase